MGSHAWVCDHTVKMMHRLRGRSARCWSCSNIFCLTDPTGLSHAASQVHLVWHASHLILLKTQPKVQTQTGFWLFEATYHFLRRQCRAVRKSTTCQSAPVFLMVLRIFVRFIWSSDIQSLPYIQYPLLQLCYTFLNASATEPGPWDDCILTNLQ